MKGITVKELIELLQEQNQDAEVHINMLGEHAPYQGLLYTEDDDIVVIEL